MYFVLTGEGNSDLGYSAEHPGVLVRLLEKLASDISDEDLGYEFASRSDLAAKVSPNSDSPRSMLLRGNKRKYSYLITIQRTAEALGRIASELENTGAVFFHDCDFTHSEVNNPDEYYRQVVCSMEQGFKSASYSNGVPMVPKPRSESWLLCYYQDTPYENCARFEDLPANDRAENSGKKQLARFFNCRENKIYENVNIAEIDWDQIDAPSFVFFKNRFQHVVERLTGQPVSMPESKTIMLENYTTGTDHGEYRTTSDNSFE